MVAPSHISSPNEPFPTPAHLSQATDSRTQRNFVISTRKLPISKAGPIDAMSEAIGIPIPEMIFGDNLVSVRHLPSGFTVEFSAADALDEVDKDVSEDSGNLLRVAYAREWSQSREAGLAGDAGVKGKVKPYDWSYSTKYRGTVIAGNKEDENRKKEFQPTEKPIPVELLMRRDPILFYDNVMLYESELDDNGVSVLSVKVRVHEQRMLVLARLYMRLDNVVVRVRDTRIYVDFDTEEVTREYTAREGGFEDVKKMLLMKGFRPDDITVALRDANQIADLLPIVDHSLQAVSLKD